MPRKPNRYKMSKSWREKIRIGELVTRLSKHAHGEIEMTSTQIHAAKLLLAKVAPDLKAIEHSGEINHRHAEELSRDELQRIAATGRTGDTEAGRRSGKPNQIH